MAVAEILNVTPRKAVDVATGLEEDVRAKLASDLSTLLIEDYRLTMKTHVYHWNVVGPLFKSVHELTEQQYQDLFEAADTIAERIRALGFRAPVNATDMKVDLDIVSQDNGWPKAHTMIQDLVQDHETIAARMREVAAYAGDHRDIGTEDMLTARIRFHEKAAWMLRSILTE